MNKDTSWIKILDLDFMGETSAISSYLIESEDGLIIVDTGPETTFKKLKEEIQSKGYDWKEVRHVFLTHIHFDHAGAAWKLAQNGAKIYVHPIGLPHLENPEKLWNSAKRIYKENMEMLWGKMEAIDSSLLIPIEDQKIFRIGEYQWKAHYTPGHAIHHNSYQIKTIIFTGDVAGVKINNGPVVPPCPPPDIHIENWLTSIEKLRKLNPSVIFPTHFGKVENVPQHLSDLEDVLKAWAKWIHPYYIDQTPVKEILPKFMTYTHQQLVENGASKEDIQRYARANPAWMSVSGLLRYWKLKDQGRI